MAQGMNFKARAKKLRDAMSELAFDQSGDAGSTEDLIMKTLEAVYERGVADGASIKTTAKSPQNPEGGWLPPDSTAYTKFWDEVYEEAKRRFGVDEDGDACVTVELTDRSREERIRLLTVPRRIEDSPYHPYGKRKWIESHRDEATGKYVHPKHTPEEEEMRRQALLENEMDRYRTITGNMSIMQEHMRIWLLDYEFNLRRKIEAPERKRSERIKRLEDLKAIWENPEKYAKKHGFVYDDRTIPTPTMRYIEGTKLCCVHTKPADFDALMEELKTLKAYKPPKRLEL